MEPKDGEGKFLDQTMKKSKLMRSNEYAYRILVKGGKWVDIGLVLMVYRCEECHAKLKRWNAGVICSENPNHKHVIHRNDVAKIQEKEIEDLRQAQQDYTIKDGQLIYEGQIKL